MRRFFGNRLKQKMLLPGLALLGSGFVLAGEPDADRLYQQHCAACHGETRLGGMGPPLFPENLTRLRKPAAVEAIAEGLPATQMPGFGEILDEAEIAALVELIYSPPAVMPVWNEDEILASHVIHHPSGDLGDEPIFDTPDPLNLFIVVELADHHATLLDGTTLESLHRFETRPDLHGGPKFSPDGRFVYFASRAGWISKFDIYNLETVAEIRAGISTRNAAVSTNGRYVLVGNYLPHTLVVLDAEDLSLLRVIPVADDNGDTSRVSAVYDAAPRNSFIAALKDIPEVWEIHYDEASLAENFTPRRMPLDDYLDDFFFDQGYVHLIGASRDAGKGQVVHLDQGRRVASVDLPGMPHLGSGITWEYQDRTVMATPNLREGVVSIIDMANWETIERIDTLGPGFFMRSHENTPYAWVDVFFGPHSDAMHVIDKATLEIVATLRPQPGTTAGHVEFSRDGGYALVSIWDDDGALVIYDSATLEEVKRIPMAKPSGKYNVYNKITLSPGTSH